MLELENKCAVPTFLMPSLFSFFFSLFVSRFLGDYKTKIHRLLPLTSASTIAIMVKAQKHKVKIILF